MSKWFTELKEASEPTKWRPSILGTKEENDWLHRTDNGVGVTVAQAAERGSIARFRDNIEYFREHGKERVLSRTEETIEDYEGVACSFAEAGAGKGCLDVPCNVA